MLSFGFQNIPEEVAVPANGPNGKPPAGERTGRQDLYALYGDLPWAGPCFTANGSTVANPCGFPGYGRLYTGTPATYRFMRRHPRIAHARAQVTNAIAANTWSWEAREGTPDAWVKLVRDMFDCQRLDIVENALYALDYGWAPGEPVWTPKEGRWWVEEIKPLSVDSTGIMVDKATGRFAGLRYAAGDDGWLRVADRKCFLFTYQGESGDLYGVSRLENLRETAWRDWLDAATQLYRLTEKASGIIPVVKTPAGTFKDSAGNTKSWKDNATAAVQALRNGQGIWFPTLAVPENRTPDNIALAKISLISIDVLDLGDQGPAIMATLERMRYDEDQMFAGYLRSPRTGMATEGGTKADSVTHTDTDTTDLELIDAKIARAFNRQIVDEVLAVNFGEAARGAVWAEPAKLRDEHRETDYKVLDAILLDPEFRAQYLRDIDADAITERRGIPKIDGKMITFEDVLPPVPPLKGQLPNGATLTPELPNPAAQQ